MNKKVNAIYGLVAILVAWVSINTYNIGNTIRTATDIRHDNAKINEIIADMVQDTTEEELLSDDDCGECDGDGATRWFADRDGDGLGDSTTFTTSCGEPLASK